MAVQGVSKNIPVGLGQGTRFKAGNCTDEPGHQEAYTGTIVLTINVLKAEQNGSDIVRGVRVTYDAYSVQKAAECGLTSSNHPHWIPVQNSTLHKSL
jgi:hypothetical protein